MESEVIENFRSLTSRGSEIGGVLLGSVIPGSPLIVVVQDYETIRVITPVAAVSVVGCRSGTLRTAIEQHSGTGNVPVAGFFRAHSRKGLSLDADDLAFLDARFRGPNSIALLVRPFATKTSVAPLHPGRRRVPRRSQLFGVSVPFFALTASLWTPPEAAAAAPRRRVRRMPRPAPRRPPSPVSARRWCRSVCAAMPPLPRRPPMRSLPRRSRQD